MHGKDGSVHAADLSQRVARYCSTIRLLRRVSLVPQQVAVAILGRSTVLFSSFN